MKTEQTLYRRALRMLTDGRQHSTTALQWAARVTSERGQRRASEMQRAGFTLAEISLGAWEVAR